MKNVKVSDTHNFAVVGHAAHGKTSLGEAVLHAAGATNVLGKVTDGSSTLNHLPEEKERQTTISSTIYVFDWNDKHLTLVDTPGDPNFQADGRVALHALDGAVLVVSAVEGARIGTQRMWSACEEGGLPVLAYVNGLDRERADLDAAVESLRGLGISPALITLPIGEPSSLSGVVDLLRMKAITAQGEAEIPGELAEAAGTAREALIEAVAECDDALLEKYLEDGELSEEEVVRGLVAGTRSRKIVPVFC